MALPRSGPQRTFPDTGYGRRARELVDAGILRALSAEFIIQQARQEGRQRAVPPAPR